MIPPSFGLKAKNENNKQLEVNFSGAWLVLQLSHVEKDLMLMAKNKGIIPLLTKDAKLDCIMNIADIQALDTSGALALNMMKNKIRDSGVKVEFAGVSQNYHELLELASAPPEKEEPEEPSAVLVTLHNIGQRVFQEFQTFIDVLSFSGLIIVTLTKTILKPWTTRWTSIFYHMEQAGVMAVPIVGLLSFLIGMVLAYMSADQLTKLGAQPYVINLLEVSLLRELGPMLTAIVIAGRSGSAYTAEIGAMVTNQEIDAMRVFGFDPIRYLVIPRVIALAVTFPLLVFLADLLGLLGGWVALFISYDMDLFSFVSRLREIIEARHIWVGIVKAPVFALAISLIGCYQGFQATGSADSVGKLTTKSVVEAIFMVIIINAVFAISYSKLGI